MFNGLCDEDAVEVESDIETWCNSLLKEIEDWASNQRNMAHSY